MGLAASQARFLGITARKNACEMRSAEIAQERLSVSNQLSQASQNYMTSLNATKIIWNPEHTNDGYVYELDYASMSRPNAFNDYQLQLLTNTKGQTVLDSTFYNALQGRAFTTHDEDSFGFLELSDNGGKIVRNIDNFRTFIGALNDQGIVSDAQYTQMISALDYQDTHPNSAQVYLPENGFGANFSNLRKVYSADLMGLCDYIDDITTYGEDYLNDLYQTYGSNQLAPTPYDMAAEIVSLLNFDTFLTNVSGTSGISVVKKACTPQPAEKYIYSYIYGEDTGFAEDYLDSNNDGNPDEDWTHSQEFNLADALGSNMLALVGCDRTWANSSNSATANAVLYVDLIDSFVDNLENIAKKFFEFTGVADEDALARTRTVIETLYKNIDGTLRTTDANFVHRDNNYNEEQDLADTYIGGLPDYLNYCIPVTQEDNISNNSATSNYITHVQAYALSLSNLAQAFFTEYENQRSLGTSGYYIATSTGYIGDCNLITSNQIYAYDYIDAGTTNPDGEISQILNYYSQMFNQICEKGYIYNAAVDDPEKLQNMLQNGYLAVNTIGDDNYFYQYDYLAYTIGNGYFKEVPDENTITTAEAEYKVKQAQLNAKEEELSVDMQTVEAELATLNTEYETVKNLISKSAQKDFTACGG